MYDNLFAFIDSSFKSGIHPYARYYLFVVLCAFIAAVIQSLFRGEFSNLAKSIAFYKSYHMEKVNVFIHFLCIWPILFTYFFFMQSFNTFNFIGLEVKVINMIAALYIIVYLYMDKLGIASIIGSWMIVACWYFSSMFYETGIFGFNRIDTFNYLFIYHLLCWSAQIYGHYVHEGRQPALLANLAQAFLFAPLFVIFELLWSFGMYEDLFKNTLTQAKRNILSLKRK